MNVHSFSYFGKGLGISQRVVNESAAVVDYFSRQSFGTKSGGGRLCSCGAANA